ncbi:hypothetical protein B5X24_HaOG213945 [Helicoverpa armigera]|uniref:Uncharacterized protein n=1 Tax=Helicoverpa armigera TaxID=29058 RepID=A0A2W1BCW6_HELAM|nr:hypothetical protein B5X24_HaOG213945 [Helicoverpa armigera]
MGIKSEILIQIPRERKHITGEPIRGIVKFHLDKETVFKNISLSFIQKSYCTWVESARAYEERFVFPVRHRLKVGNIYRFDGQENKVLEKIDFLDKETNQNVKLKFGSYEYPFEILIPEELPPSIKTDIGSIKYYFVLKFEKPGLSIWNKTFKTKVSIYPRIDTSLDDEPVNFTMEKDITDKKISIKGELEKGSFNSTDERRISFEVTNNSDVTFDIKTELVSSTKYTDTDPILNHHKFLDQKFEETKTVEEVVGYCTMITPTVPDNSVANMYNILPPILPPEHLTVRHSKIISREYMVRVTLMLPVPYANDFIDIPVFIGEEVDGTEYDE